MVAPSSSTARSPWTPALRQAFDASLVEINFHRVQWLLLGLITINGVMAFLGHELGDLGRLLPRTGQLMEFLVSPVLLGLLWWLRTRPTRERTLFTWLVVAAESLACAWYFFVALPVFGPTAVFALTIIALGVFILVPPRVFVWLVLPATVFHLGLAFFSIAPLPVKILVGLHGIVAAGLALVAQGLLFTAKRADFLRDQSMVEETEALRRINRRLEMRCQDLQESTALAAHDLKSPLQSLVAALRLATQRREWRSEPHASLLREAIDTCVGLLDLGGRLLNDYQAGKGEAASGGMRPSGRVVRDLREVCREAVADLQGKMQERELTVEWRFPTESAPVRMDPPTLRGALQNLLDNAVIYSPRKSEIELRLRSEEGSWVLELRDHGPGFPEQERAAIFQRFYQAGNRPAAAPPGNGLGLWMARQRIQAQGGELLLAESGPDGSVFRVIFPRVSQPADG